MIYSGGNELLSKLFDEASISITINKGTIGDRIYNLKLKPDLLCYKDKFKIKPQYYTWSDSSKIEYNVVDQLRGNSVYPIKISHWNIK